MYSVVEYLPDTIRKHVITVILALIPLLIANLMISPFFQNPDLDLTILERKNENSDLSKFFVVIQNTGNIASNDILITFYADNKFKLISFAGTDKLPQDVSHDGGNLRLSLERLSPQAYLILETEGPEAGAKSIWVTSDRITKFLSLASSQSDSVISSVNLMENREISFLVISAFGISALLVFRYINFYKSEHTRRNYLGVHPIKIVRYKSTYLVTGIVILFFGIGGGWYIDDYNEPEPIKDYLAYQVFSIEETILPETFLQIRDPASPYSGGNVLAALSVLASLIISNRDIHLPKFIWSLSKPYAKIQLKDIRSSYLPSEEVSINTRKDVSKSKSEVFVVKEKNTVIGLLSQSC